MEHNFEQYCRESAKSFETIPDIHPDDFIFKYIVGHPNWTDPKDAVWYYFSDERSSAHKLRETKGDLGIAPSTRLSLLEFASGYGCVTRHLPKILPNVSIVASDIHPKANEFVRQKIGVKSIQSVPVPEEFPKASFYDVVFVLSFFSRMPKKTWTRWLKVLSDQLNLNGHLIFTTHGLITAHKLMPDLEFDEEGFYFHEASEQEDLSKAEYGTTVTTPSFVIRAAEPLDNCVVRVFKGGFWWGHQDLWVIQKFPQQPGTHFQQAGYLECLLQPRLSPIGIQDEN
jgi:SAM-dependent methyltransferase